MLLYIQAEMLKSYKWMGGWMVENVRETLFYERLRCLLLKIENIFALSCICFLIVLSHVLLQLIRLFAGIVALLTGKRFLAGL